MILCIFISYFLILFSLCKKSFYENRERAENNFDSIWKRNDSLK